jgi:hypothetical protein
VVNTKLGKIADTPGLIQFLTENQNLEQILGSAVDLDVQIWFKAGRLVGCPILQIVEGGGSLRRSSASAKLHSNQT